MSTYLKLIHTNYFRALLLLVVVSSCREQEIVEPDFQVSTQKTTYKVGDPITFEITGTADVVAFYSGEDTKEYRYKERDSVIGKPQLQFLSYRQASTQQNTLSILASTDFSGSVDMPSVQKATWTDITSKATLSTGTDNTPSGVIDLSEFVTAKQVYFAFKYTATSTSAQPTWTIKSIAFDNVQADGTKLSLATSANLAWGALNILNPAKVWAFTTAQIQFTTSAAGTADNEDWIITQPLRLNGVKRNRGVNIKVVQTKLTSYVFPGYAKAGTYTVTFEAINSNRWDKKTTVKEFTITVQ